jgi:hypothetical protein
MSKAQILFSVNDPWGHLSNNDLNFENHARLKNGDIYPNKFFPRGKSYWNLYAVQCDSKVAKEEAARYD